MLQETGSTSSRHSLYDIKFRGAVVPHDGYIAHDTVNDMLSSSIACNGVTGFMGYTSTSNSTSSIQSDKPTMNEERVKMTHGAMAGPVTIASMATCAQPVHTERMAMIHGAQERVATIHGSQERVATTHGAQKRVATIHGAQQRVATIHGAQERVTTTHGS